MKRSLMVIILLGLMAFAPACGDQSPEETPAVQQPTELTRVVSVSGRVVPVRWTLLSFGTGGRLAEVLVEEGQEVTQGQELASLDQAGLDLALRAASEALVGQQSLLAQAQATPVPVDVAAAKAQLDAARAALRALEDLPETRDLEEARLQVEVAKNNLWATQLEEEGGGVMASTAKVVRARAAAAEQTLHIAELQYERVKAGTTDDALASARGAVAEAEAAADRLERGASKEELDALRAAVHGAEVAVDRAQWQLDQSQLLAPFAGTVVQVDARSSEHMAPGVPVITLADLGHLRLETTDLDELDLARVQVGQAVDLTFDALPDDVLHGRVARIADMASTGRAGASFVVVVTLDQQDARLRWGMSAFVDIRVE